MELEHHGVKGQKHGQRRYQTKDGTWTPLGLKLRRAREGGGGSSNDNDGNERKSSRASAALRKLRSNFVKKTKTSSESDKKKEETDEEREERERKERQERHDKAIKSANAKEIYENRDVLSTAEIKERIDRIKTEQELSKYIVKEPTRMEKAMKKVDSITKTLGKVESVYKAVNTPTMKELGKQLGIYKPEPYKAPLLNDIYNNRRRMTSQQIKDALDRYKNEEEIRNLLEAEERRRQGNNNNNNNNNNRRRRRNNP